MLMGRMKAPRRSCFAGMRASPLFPESLARRQGGGAIPPENTAYSPHDGGSSALPPPPCGGGMGLRISGRPRPGHGGPRIEALEPGGQRRPALPPAHVAEAEIQPAERA